MNRKRIAILLAIGVVMATLAMAIVPGLAFAQYQPATGGAATGGAATGGATGTTGTATTGGELIVFGLAGAALIGSGYFLTRKSKA